MKLFERSMLEIHVSRLRGPLTLEATRAETLCKPALAALSEVLKEHAVGSHEPVIRRNASYLQDLKTFHKAFVAWRSQNDGDVRLFIECLSEQVRWASGGGGRWASAATTLVCYFKLWIRIENMRAYVHTPGDFTVRISFEDALEIPGLLENYTA
jgi:hypothetical protein